MPEEYAAQVHVDRVAYTEARGPCWARHHLWRHVDPARDTYLLSIDCHMRFERGWDSYLVDQLRRCPSARPVLTGYPLGFTEQRDRERRSSVLCASRFDESGMLRTAGRLLERVHDDPLPSLFWAAGFRYPLLIRQGEVENDSEGQRGRGRGKGGDG